MKTYLTVKELKRMHACPIGYRKFKKRFGNAANIKDLLRWVRFLRKPEWEGWLLAQTPALTEALIANGADVHACENYALFFAESENRADVLKLLQKAG